MAKVCREAGDSTDHQAGSGRVRSKRARERRRIGPRALDCPYLCLGWLLLVLVAASLLLSLASPASAAADLLEQDLQNGLADSASLVELIQTKLAGNADAAAQLARLRTFADNIRVTDLLIEERFRQREEKAKALGSTALDRQQEVTEGFREALAEYLSIVNSLPAASGDLRTPLRKLTRLLSRLHPPKHRPLIGSLPYRHLNLPAREPATGPSVDPAYAGGDRTVRPEDTAPTPEAPASAEIAALAQTLGWNPVSIYEYVKNNMETEWYWGCMKGAEETLRQKGGNDCDQATLLVALLRASGYPSRFVRGTIEFFPDMERAKHLTGIDSAPGIVELFRKAGIPHVPVIAGGKIANIRFEHLWVETQVPYANYRGALIDDNGKTWLGLETSIKVKGYEYSAAQDLFGDPAISSQLSALRDEYLGALQIRTPLEYLKDRITSISSQQDPDLTAESYKLARTPIPEHLKILPASLQFTTVSVAGELATVPAELRHTIKLSAVSLQQNAGSRLFEITMDASELSNRNIIVTFEPETVEDQKVIDSFGGLDSTPAYLVRLRPVLKVDNERKIVAEDGLPMGSEFDLSIELLGPGLEPEWTTNRMIVGNVAAIGIVAGKAVQSSPFLVQSEENAEQLIHNEAMNYIDRWNRSEEELASLMHLVLARPLPTVATVGNLMDVAYVLDVPHHMTWKGVYCDADVRRIEAISCQQSGSSQDRIKLFTQLSSLEGSVLEHRLFEDDLGVESISTAKLIELAGGQLYTIDGTNVDTVLPALPVSEDISGDIRNSVNQGLVVRLPQADGLPLSAYSYDDWTGVGYLKENPATGESGWMLSGMIAGGTPALSPENWANQSLVEIFSHPFGGKANTDPLAAAKLLKITATDMQQAIAGQVAGTPLMAFAVDGANQPVPNAEVTFTVKAGGGTLQCTKADGSMTAAGASCAAKTGENGIVMAWLTVGKKTIDNPGYIKLNPADVNDAQVGINLVEASVSAHGGAVRIDSPFEALGLPGPGVRIMPVFPKRVENTNSKTITVDLADFKGMPNTPGGNLAAALVDANGNPVSNATLTFKSTSVAVANDPKLSQAARPIHFYHSAACSGISYPLFGECSWYGKEEAVTTDYIGGKVDYVFGNTVETKYSVEVTAPNAAKAVFTLYTDGTMGAEGSYLRPGLSIGYLELYNDQGQLANAAKAGDILKLPLAAKLYATYEDIDTKTSQYACMLNNQPSTCWKIEPLGTITAVPVSNGNVTFEKVEGGGEPQPVVNAGKGVYRAGYRTAAVPAKDLVMAWGEATVSVPQIFYDADMKVYASSTEQPQTKSVSLKTGREISFDKDTGAPHELFCLIDADTKLTSCITDPGPQYIQTAQYTVFGINVGLVAEPKMVLLDDRNFTTEDMKLNYTVLPAEYSALAVDLNVYKTASGGSETLAAVLYGDKTQGQGSGAFGRGSVFDASTLYTAEAVLNPGSDMEVRGPEKKVELPVVVLRVKDDQNEPVDEVKFGNGGRPDKKYKIELISAALAKNCGDPSGIVRTVLKSGETASTPGVAYYPPEYMLTFEGSGTVCNGRIGNKDRFILSNLSKDGLAERVAELKQKKSINVDLNVLSVLYGGLGNRMALSLGTTRLKDVPIEPVGVFIFGIDGLRQDVLYPAQVTSTSTATANYSDMKGCGGGSCYIAPTHLTGLCEVLGGRYGSTCDTSRMMEKHIKLPDVTAIFPSITFASWASIFTGKLPKDTGILGNEFFARDLYEKKEAVIGLDGYPRGMVTLDADGGAFRPREGFLASPRFALKYAIPSEFLDSSYSGRLALSAPTAVLTQTPLWADIGDRVGAKYQTKNNEDEICENTNYECRTVSIFNQYPKGADQWGTGRAGAKVLYDAATTLDSAVILDSAATERAMDFIADYFKQTTASGKRKRFPALFSVYLAGLDHNAHLKGMSEYPWYFTQTTDMRVQDIVKALKDQDEFDNKIFIVVADHGHTAMPEGLTRTDKKTGKQYKADISCELKADNFDDPKKQLAEMANNNLHIWELANLFTQFPSTVSGVTLRLLAPKQIADLTTINGATSIVNTANVIAALNGPMAHIYIKGADWKSDPDPQIMNSVISLLMAVFKNGIDATGTLRDMIDTQFPRLAGSITGMLVRSSGQSDYEVVTDVTADASGTLTLVTTALTGSIGDVDVVNRINNINIFNRSGDIVLLMKDATTGDATGRYSTGYACKSWHGSLNSSDSYVPLIMSYPGGNKSEISVITDTVCGNNGCKGNWNMSELIKGIIRIQY